MIWAIGAKHPDLHGYIVETFADGVDECQDIWLEADDLKTIIAAIDADQLKHGTQGFFFGKSYQPGQTDEYGGYAAQKAEDLAIFREALAWLAARQSEGRGWMSDVFYRASW